MNCEKCKYFCEGHCSVVLWADGRQVRIREVKPDLRCWLWEEKHD